MNFGIIGGGMIARFHAEAIRRVEGSTLQAVYARRLESADTITSEFGGRAFDDLDAFLADPDLDIVTIATPSGAHLEPAVAAARAGKHVICEKPIEVTTDRVDEMIDACDRAGVVLAGVFNRRFHPTMQLLKRAVDAGRFGRLTLCEASVRWYRDDAYYASAPWRGTWALDGGGALMNQSIHAIDQLLYLAGPVKHVHAFSGTLGHRGIEVEDTAVATLEFESGALGTIRGSTACWSATGNPAEITICGTQGTVYLDDERFRRWQFADPDEHMDAQAARFTGETAAGAGANDPKAINCDGHVANFSDVVESIRDNRRPIVDGREARRAVDLICRIYEVAGTKS
ncbi:MAG: Gfo/Idh/MocA family oxidoreductase [Bacteroidetes bacterium]|nr:Gfo/Idh/MocA family oxidoreductase [Bacteroidota bacterium]